MENIKDIISQDWFIATIVMAVVYILVGVCLASVSPQWNHQRIIFHPLKVVAGSNRVASWSTLQILFITFIVLWLTIFWFLKHDGLVKLEGDLALLLGIAGAGTAIGKAADNRRSMLSQVNFSWIKSKKWIDKDLIKGKFGERKPRFCDLITTDGKFDIARFQAVGFTSVIGVALFLEGISADIVEDGKAFSFSIGQTYLALIGVSQGLYVGGKFSQKDKIKQLDQILDQVREKEQTFKTSVSGNSKWIEQSGSHNESPNQLFDLARECAIKEYNDFLNVAQEASNLVSELSGKQIYESEIRPFLPPVYSLSS